MKRIYRLKKEKIIAGIEVNISIMKNFQQIIILCVLFYSTLYTQPLHSESLANSYFQIVNEIVTYKIEHSDIEISFDFENNLAFINCSMIVQNEKDKTRKIIFILPSSAKDIISISINGEAIKPNIKEISFVKLVTILNKEQLIKGNTYKVNLNYTIDTKKYPGIIDKDYIEMGLEIAFWLPLVLEYPWTFNLKATLPKEFYAQANAGGKFEIKDNNKIYTFTSNKPRITFPRFYASTLKPIIKKKNNLTVELHTPDEFKELSDFIINSTLKILDFYQNIFGIKYDSKIVIFIRKPREGDRSSFGGNFIVALSGFSIREYLLKKDKEMIEKMLFYLLSHELGHSIFPERVYSTMFLPGNAFLIEGFAEYCMLLASENHYKDKNKFKQILMDEHKRCIKEIKKLGNNILPLSKISTLDEYEGPRRIAYSKGALVLHILRYIIGDENFFSAFRNYIKQYTGKIASISDFEKVMQEYSKDSISWFFDDYIDSLKDLDFSIKNVQLDKENRILNITIENIGEASFGIPVEIMVKTNRGEKITKIDLSKKENKLKIPIDGILKEIEIDPNYWIVDIDRENNTNKCAY